MKLDVLTKSDLAIVLKESERKLANQINRRVNQRLNEAKKEETLLEKKILEKQDAKDKKEWSLVKNKEERLLAMEQKISSVAEYLEKITARINEMTERFNSHVEDNNNKFDLLSGRGSKIEVVEVEEDLI